MATQEQFTGLGFVLTSALAVDVSTVAATFNYSPVIGSGTYSLLSSHGDVRTVVQGAGGNAHQVYLHTNLPLTQDLWTLTYLGVQESPSLVVVTPGAFPFWVGFGVAPVGIATPPFSGEDLTAEQFLRREIPPSMKGNVWSCLIAGLAVGEQVAWDNAPSVERQMFLATAAGQWLDRRAAGLGLERPSGVGMPDDAFRDYSIQVSSRQLTIPAILEALKVFYGTEAVQASAQSNAESFVLVDGQSLTITFDNVQIITVTFRVADFANISLALAQEVAGVLNREFLMQGVNAEALVVPDPSTGLAVVRIHTGTLGARGSVQVAPGAAQAALGLPTTLARLPDQPRAAYVLTRGKGHVEVIFPATTSVVARTDVDAAYLSGGSPSGIGPYLFEGVSKGLAITEIVTTLTSAPLLAGQEYRLLTVANASSFPDVEGWVVFGYGYDYQSGPVHYLGRAGPTAILIDPDFVFTQNVPVGANVNLLASNRPPTSTPDQIGDFWLTDSPAGRVAAEATIDTIAAAGYEVDLHVSYPGDVGLGYAGHPTHGVQALSDIVQCFAGADVDAEVEAARDE